MNIFFKKGYLPYLISGILILLSFFNPFYNSAISFEDKASKEISESILLLEEIETLTIPLAETIPFLKSWAHTYENDFDKLLSYLNFADLLMLLQLGILKLSEWWVFKLVLVISFLGLFNNYTKSICKNLLIIGLLITPGLGIYTQLLSSLSNQMEIDLGADLKSNLLATKDSINTKKELHKSSLEALKAHQKSKNKGRLNLFDKVEDEAINIGDSIVDDIDQAGEDLLDVLRFAGHHGLELAVSLMSNILIIFGILPVLFWYLMSLALQRLFQFDKPLQEIDKKLESIQSITKS